MTSALALIDDAEVAVIGGGPAGAVAAFTLASMGRDVVLVDKCSFPRDKTCGDAHMGSVGAFLHELGLDQALAGAHPVNAIRMFVDWRERGVVSIAPRARAGSHQPCCLPRQRFDDALVQAACAAGARLVKGYVTRPLYDAGSLTGVELEHADGRRAIRASHLIAADGATSRLRRVVTGQSGRQSLLAIAARQYVSSDCPFGSAREVYLPLPDGLAAAGYGWVFPVGEHLANVGVGYLTTRGLPRPPSLSRLLDSFLTGLRAHRGGELGRLERVGPVSGFPLSMGFSPERSEVGGVVFVGDAGHTTDPVTGEGVDQAMRSAHAAALAIDRAIRRRRRPVGIGRSIAATNLRSGQDPAMIAHLARAMLVARGDPQSQDPLRAPTPVISAAAAMITAEAAHPSLLGTAAGRLASRLGRDAAMSALERRLRNEAHTGLILATELILRETCAGVGPVGALVLLASQAARDPGASAQAVDGSVAIELLRASPAIFARVTAGVGKQAKLNNALALMTGDHALSRAAIAAAGLGADVSRWVGDAIVATCEGFARSPRHRHEPEWAEQAYLDSVRLERGASVALAARIGARLAGANAATASTLGAVGEAIGIAVRICEEILALVDRDPVTGREPRHVIEDGAFALPVIFAAQNEPSLAPRLVGPKERAEWDELLEVIRQGPGMARAAEVCRRYAASAKRDAAAELGDDSALAAVCDLPLLCLAPLGLPAVADPLPPDARAGAHRLRLAS